MKGHLVVYVYGYIVEDWRCSDHNYPPQLTGERGWTTENGGWAFGDNSRSRYCSITSDKIRKFTDFESAIAAIYQQQRKKRRNERYQLVYRIGGDEHVITSEDEIRALDAPVVAHEHADAVRKTEHREDFNRRHPELDLLRSLHSPSHALSLSEFLGEVRQHGFEAAITNTGIARSSAFRYRKLLIQAGIEINC